jgi:hypothetical protein
VHPTSKDLVVPIRSLVAAAVVAAAMVLASLEEAEEHPERGKVSSKKMVEIEDLG